MPRLACLLIIIFLFASSVAATGLPDPRPEHAVAMARFARDCLRCMRDAVNKLELSLGPDTADLQLRIGIHSGPITAGECSSCANVEHALVC